jgi:hypothetical protein
MVCEALSGCICDMEIHNPEWKKLETIVLSVLHKHLGQNRHVCRDNFYRNMKLIETLLDKEVCGTVLVNSGIPHDLEKEAKGECGRERQKNQYGNKETVLCCPVQ